MSERHEPEPRDAGTPFLVHDSAGRVFGSLKGGEVRVFIELTTEKRTIVLLSRGFAYEGAATGWDYGESGTHKFRSLMPQFGAVTVKASGKDDVSFASYADFIDALRRA